MSCWMTSVNSVRPSSLAPVAARVMSWERRASDSMIRSSTVSWAILAATWAVIVGSKELTFEATLGAGNAGSIQTRADADTGTELPAGGRASPAVLATQTATPGPLPTISGTVGVVPSASPATGAGLWVERSADTGRIPAHKTATVTATGTRHVGRPRTGSTTAPGSKGATNRASANRS